jgi:hypothetical protein
MKKYHIFESLFLSFYSKPFYREVAQAWKGLGLLFLLLVLAICWLPFSYDFHRFLDQFSAEFLPGIVEQMPTMTLSQGKLSIDKPSPYTIKLPGSSSSFIVFDTSVSGSVSSLPADILLTQDKLTFNNRMWGGDGRATIYPLSNLSDGTITRAKFREGANQAVFLSSILMYPMSVIFSFLYRLIQAIFLGFLGLLFAYMFKVKITYKTAVRLAVVALAPMLFITTLIEYFVPIPFLPLVSLLLAVGYLAYAVHAQQNGLPHKPNHQS